MQNKTVSQRIITVAQIFVAVNLVLIIARSATNASLFGILSTVLITLFSFYHGVKLYSWRAMFFFVAMITMISWGFETCSILTGFPFGNYHYTDKLPPKIGLVPAIIMPAYFAMGYLSWTIAHVLLGKKDNTITGSDIWIVPTFSSFVMVMWDMTMDPFNATISEFWIWHDAGAYFGVPFVNFLGWFLCVFTFYFVFAVFLRMTCKEQKKRRLGQTVFWTLPIWMYLSRTVEYFGNMAYENEQVTDQAGHVWHTADINTSMALVSIFTMIFVSFLGLALLYRTPASQDQ